MSPLEFLVVTQTLGNNLPQIGELKYLDGARPKEFREFYQFN